MAIITALDLISRSLRLINGIAAGETAGDEDAEDCLETLNEMIENWNTEKISVYGKVNEIFTLLNGVASYTIGTGGDFNTDRPVYIEDAFVVVDGTSYELRVCNQTQYDRISLKNQPDGWPYKMLYVNAYPLGQLTFWPVPNIAGVQLQLAISRQLTEITSLSQQILLPPGYKKALRYCLAVDLWPEYANSTTDIATIKVLATGAKADIGRTNMVDPIAFFDDVPGTNREFDNNVWV